MICLECGKTVRNINYKHLKNCSGITQREYLQKHPNSQLVDEDVKRTYGSPLEKNPKWKDGRSLPKKCLCCGKEIDSRSKRCPACNIRYKDNPFKGKHHSDESKIRMSASAKKRDKSTYVQGYISSEKRSISAKKYWSKFTKEQRLEKTRFLIDIGQKCNKKSSRTKIEESISKILYKINTDFERNKEIFGKYVDFYIANKNIIIECYGDYWHCNPLVYSEDYYHKNLHMTAKEKWNKDKERAEFLEKKGMVVIVFWERDIIKSSNEIEAYIKNYLEINSNNFSIIKNVYQGEPHETYI